MIFIIGFRLNKYQNILYSYLPYGFDKISYWIVIKIDNVLDWYIFTYLGSRIKIKTLFQKIIFICNLYLSFKTYMDLDFVNILLYISLV